MDLGREEWLDALGMDAAAIPKAVILEGSWWRAQRTEWRLSYLDDVHELAFPDMYYGFWQETPVVYSYVHGAPRAVELAHLFSRANRARNRSDPNIGFIPGSWRRRPFEDVTTTGLCQVACLGNR